MTLQTGLVISCFQQVTEQDANYVPTYYVP